MDAQGNVVKHKFVEVSTFKVNAKQQKLEEFAAHEKVHPNPYPPNPIPFTLLPLAL